MEKEIMSFLPICPNRRSTGSLKYDGMTKNFGSNDAEPFWVADMDFKSPAFVFDAIKKKTRHKVLGYPVVEPQFYQSICGWYDRRFHASITPEMVTPMVGVVISMFAAVMALSAEGDGVIVQPPVYGPFFKTVRCAKRRLLENPLLMKNGRYEIDYDGFEALCKREKPTLLLFCSPHNPGGRVWEESELERLVSVCRCYGVTIISDEIHADLVYHLHRHIPLFAVSGAADMCCVLSAPTKSFNIPALNISYIITPSKKIRDKICSIADMLSMTLPNSLGIEALIAAYTYGDGWIDTLMPYLDTNRQLVDSILAESKTLKGMMPEATYLYWIDIQETDLRQKEFMARLAHAKLALSGGDYFFGGNESGFVRFNFATNTKKVEKAVRKLVTLFG